MEREDIGRTSADAPPGFPAGLSSATAAERMAAEGPNEFDVDQRRTLLAIAAQIAREPMFLLLFSAGITYMAIGDVHEAFILIGFVVIIMATTILQERRTEKALESLRDLSSPRALVIRDGAPKRIPGREVVRGDILLLAEGDRVPADGEVLQAHELAADESMLTGEPEAVAKFAEATMSAGTLVVRGQGVMLVTATGSGTELGKIGKSLGDIEQGSSPMQDEVGHLTKRLAMVGVALCLILATLYGRLVGGWLDGILAGITLAMGILPQELPVILVVFLALGARRIARKRVLTRHLNAIETLGETTVLCVDKTGTLTQNRMEVAALSVAGSPLKVGSLSSLPEPYHELLEYAVLASEIAPHDPMEQAFHRFAHEFLANTEHLHPEWALAREYELSPELLAMSHVWRNDSGQHDIVAAKGAPEAIADLCHLPAHQRDDLLREAERMADAGLRVLAVAKGWHNVAQAWPDIQHDFDFDLVGLVGLVDPVRPEVPAAVAECRGAGIRVVMITGDHPVTAKAIAREAGLEADETLTGTDLAASGRLGKANVIARVTPRQKLAIVEALKAGGEVVAMTGDGVNDAPALKAAHIGIAMGKRGTDVAREAASLVLMEDDFGAIVAAIHQGRRIFANLRQALVYTLAVHVPIVALSVLPLLFGMPMAFAPIHIAFLELVIDPACSVAFEAEEGRRDLMAQPPRSPSVHLIESRHLVFSLILGLLTTACVAGAYAWWLSRGLDVAQARGLAFVTLVTANAVLILPCRSGQARWRDLTAGLSSVGAWVVGGTLVFLAAISRIPALSSLFAFQVSSLADWLIAFGAGLAMIVTFQMAKSFISVLPAKAERAG
jgi:Ca2+-transporting ATPase